MARGVRRAPVDWVKNLGDRALPWDTWGPWDRFNSTDQTTWIWFPRKYDVRVHDRFVIYAAYGPGTIVGFGEVTKAPFKRPGTDPAVDRYPWAVVCALDVFVEDPRDGWFVQGQVPLPQWPSMRFGSKGSLHRLHGAGVYDQLQEQFRQQARNVRA